MSSFPRPEICDNLNYWNRSYPRPRQIQPPSDAMIEDFDLEDVDPRGQARAQGVAGTDEDEEDGVPHGAERMQCASQ